jgi:hypothetical protein
MRKAELKITEEIKERYSQDYNRRNISRRFIEDEMAKKLSSC